jgi:diguanylate cyclase (GGDEF)-like protein
MARRKRPIKSLPWLIVSVVVVAVGVVASVRGAQAWKADETRRTHQNFSVAANGVTSALRASLQRYGDLVQNVGGLFQQHLVTSQQFNDYLFESGFYANSYPGTIGIGFVQPVLQSQLNTFLSAARADGVPDYQVSPTGSRSQYCLSRYADTLGQLATVPLLGYDFCATDNIRAALTTARDSGEQTVISGAQVSTSVIDDFIILAPIYSGNAQSIGERRATIMGWSFAIVSGPDFEEAVLGTQNSGLVFKLSAGTRPTSTDLLLTNAAGVGFPTRWSVTDGFVAHSRWTVQVAPSETAFVTSGAGPETLEYVGILTSALLGLLLWLLTFSRTRALALVRRRTEQLEHLALHDALTGLPNRALIMDRADQMLMRAARQGSFVGALFLDIDGFKDINDSLGHEAGDHVLRSVGTRLSTAVRGSETVGRLGGDEFVVLVEDDGINGSPGLVAERLLAVLAEPFYLLGVGDLEVRASIGVAGGRREDAEGLLRDADLALYQAKAQGKNQYVVFHSEMQTAAHERRVLEADLRHALERDQMFVVYQPTFNLGDKTLIGVEALLRWRHPERELIPPDVFIPIAEEIGLMGQIGRFVLHQACAQAASWHGEGYLVGMAVNVSGRQLESDDLIHDIREALFASGFDPSYLTLEVTESVLMRDVDATVQRLHTIKQMGVRLAIDDFGTGYSSLAYLQQFPVDSLKIDRSFITNMAQSSESGALIHTLVQLGKTLNLETVAEGIEDPDQVATLLREDCDSGQGFLFSRPLDPAAAREFFARHPVRKRLRV